MPAHLRRIDDRRRSQREGALDVFGHVTISITLDRYGHLMPGAEDLAAGLLDAYLAAQRERVRAQACAADGVLTGELTGEHLANGN